MGLYEIIEKTINKERGYKYHTYQTHYDEGVVSLDHYGTKIIEFDLNENEVLDFLVTSSSDNQAINTTLSAIQKFVEGWFSLSRKKIYHTIDGTKYLYTFV